ncbi:conserved hypothetical protein [Sphingomonas sp. EC-HK361]|uniref:retropepsin-like aspartic protease family protein n=1 Tax=Sphingomonas sp. EC-HK361 TaxID=2038397 RepID=UPI001256CC06|nr:TIGR02281 family clan AA aspartic protease [Sphingomonas sp. EC-HK361]VVT07714.1 conserved hypothetical protein [Sphingomonas sp. EC-HK361]
MNDQTGQAMIYALMLILPLSALLARRVPIGATVKMALAWLAIFVVGLLLVAQQDRIKPYWQRASTALLDSDQRVSGETVRIAMAADGHFWAQADINGVRRRMLIDSGATTTALSVDAARAAGIDVDESPLPVMIETANGTITARTATAKRLQVGGIVARDLPVVVSDAFDETDVIGMNFLSRLEGWRVEGTTLILQPKHADN